MLQRNVHLKFVDVAKGIGILCIVMGHVVPNSLLHQFLYAFHVPLFFILSGYTYKLKDNWRGFLLSKVKRLLFPYYVFSIISIAIYFVMAKVLSYPGDARIVPNMLGMLYANSNTGYMTWNRPLWFLPCIFSAVLLLDGFERLLHKVNRRNHIGLRLTFILTMWGLGLVLNCCLGKLVLPFHLESAVFLVGFSEAGLLFAMLTGKEGFPERISNSSKSIRFFVILVGLAAGLVLTAVNGVTDIRRHDFGVYPVLLIFTGLIFSAVTIMLSAKMEDSRFLALCGTSSMSILLMHKFPILFFQEIVPVIRDVLAAEDTAAGTLCGFAVLLPVVLMCLATERILLMICREFVGKSR